MTENQLFPMSADLFDTSSNSSNPLKFDLYASLGLNANSNSSSVSGLFCSTASLIPTLSPPPQLTIVTTTSPITTALSPASTGSGVSSNSSNGSGSGSSIGGGSGNGPSNVMLTTNAITIPRSSNSNQQNHNHHHNHNSHHNIQFGSSYRDDSLLMQHHHPNPSPLQQPNMMTQHQQQEQQQQRQALLQHNNQHGQHQHQNQHAQSPPSIADLSEYGLDALDASSLSPTLLQDVNLAAATTLHNNSNSVTPTITASGNSVNNFYTQDISQSSASTNGILTSDNHTLLSLNATLVDDVNNSLMYEVTPNSNTLWSDIGSAIVTTKNEPFTLEEDYIFPIDKTGADFSEISDNHFLEDFGNLEEFLPVTTNSTATAVSSGSGFMLSPQSNSSLHQLSSPQASPGGPPLELLQLQQHQLTQLQSLPSSHQFSSSSGSSNGGGGGAIHHAHHNHHSSSSPYDIYHSTPNKQQHHHHQQQQQQQQQQQHQLNSSSSVSNTFSPGSQPSHSPLQQLNNSSITPPPPPRAPQYQGPHVKSRNMQELLKKGFSMSPDRSSALLGQSVPGSQMLISGNALSPGSGSSGFGSTTGGSNGGSVRKSFGYQTDASSSRLSSSAPTHLGLEQIWMRREPRQHLLSTGSLAEAESYSSLSTGSVLSPEGVDLSQDDDEDASTDYNSDHYDDFSSDGSDNEDDNRTSTPNLSSSKGKERFFWQYNVQAKGPKGKRLVFQSKVEDPHHLNEVTDPVFSPNCSVRGIKVYKHSGKARKGDGNDLTPNPRKLHNIGKELDKLSRTINDMTPVSELPFNVRPKSRKEKNKLASRACRLKKKAQHEANKIKLFGLEIEHKRLLNGIAELKQALAFKYLNSSDPQEEIDQRIESLYQTTSASIRIAGGTTDFVNKVLENVKAGAPNGGLEELRNS